VLNVPGHRELRKIVVLNPKGGSGKTTLAINLAGYLASRQRPVALMDCDPQGSSTRWLERRPSSYPSIHGIVAYTTSMGTTRSWQLRVPQEIRYLVVDTPAAVPAQELVEFTRGAHAILIPVLPSNIDVHAVSRLVAHLLLTAKVSRRMGRLGVVANRVRENTLAYKKLMSFLDCLSIPVVGVLRDSQNYVHSAEEGLSVHEMVPSRVTKDLARWQPLTGWLEQKLATSLTARDLHHPILQPLPGPVVPFKKIRTEP